MTTDLGLLLGKVHCVDCLDLLRQPPDDSIDACVTDPPYGLGFMGMAWDSGAITFNADVWREVLRVLKPGAHLLAFSSPRTYHRLATVVEDVGFEIRDMIEWIYGSGFPKGQNISAAIDKKKGVKGEVIGRYVHPRVIESGELGNDRTWGEESLSKSVTGRVYGEYKQTLSERLEIIAPVSPDAIQWQGWHTSLKSSHEPIVMARKPISEETIAENVRKWGTGAINIEGCRVPVNPSIDDMSRGVTRQIRDSPTWKYGSGFRNEKNTRTGVLSTGRYPANIVLSHRPDCKLMQVGSTEIRIVDREQTENMGKYGIYGIGHRAPTETSYIPRRPEVWECQPDCPVRMMKEQDGFPRFFYCAKASLRERTLGLTQEQINNLHVSIKPVHLMRWLVRLVTPRNGIVLDHFLGSGSTAIAAENEGMSWIGCDNDSSYCDMARARIEALGKLREEDGTIPPTTKRLSDTFEA